MAREYAKTNVTIWQDADWRGTPAPAQHLYLLMWTHPSLDYCGVLDWRPGRLAQFAAGLTAESIATAGACLQARQLIVVDDETEEALLRSWIRFDGLVGHDKLSVSMAKAFAGVASNKLRGVIVDELHKLREREPELCGWQKRQVQDMLTQPRIPAKSLPVPSDPLSNPTSGGVSTPPSIPARNTLSLSGSSGSSTPLHQHLHQHPQHQQQQTSSKSVGDPKSTRIPDDFEITDAMREWAATNAPAVDVELQTARFIDYWKGVAGASGRKADWVATWRNWIRKETTGAKPSSNTKPAAAAPGTFEAWWDAYPNKKARGDAIVAYIEALTKADAATLLAGAVAFAASPGASDPEFTPYPAKWLKGERWLDQDADYSTEPFYPEPYEGDPDDIAAYTAHFDNQRRVRNARARVGEVVVCKNGQLSEKTW